jgi:hypothetical protein
MISLRSASAFGAVLFFITVSAFGQPAIPVSPYATPVFQLPPIGLAGSETAQVNVVNTATVAATSTGATAPSCTGTITFYNASGSIIGSASSFTVAGGQIFSATLPYASTGGSGSRTVIRVAIVLSTTTTSGLQPPQPPAPCALASSLETYDTATGVTHAFVSGVSAQGLTAVIRPALFAPAP